MADPAGPDSWDASGPAGSTPLDPDDAQGLRLGWVATQADLSKVDLSGADLTGADLTNANLDEANLAGVKGFDTVRGRDSIRNLDRAFR